jgi:hypothetical protein
MVNVSVRTGMVASWGPVDRPGRYDPPPLGT